MKKSNLTKAENISRKLESLALVLQDSAEIGNMPVEIYADTLEIVAEMSTELRTALSSVGVETEVTA